MSQIERQYLPLVLPAPEDLKRLILSLQEVCLVKNVDLRTIGTAKIQHMMAEALGYNSWQSLLANNNTIRGARLELTEPAKSQNPVFQFNHKERALLIQSRTGRFALDEIYFYEQCRTWRADVEDYWEEVIDLAWHKYQWDRLDVPIEERPQRPKTMTLINIEATEHGVELKVGDEGCNKFTVNLMLSVDDDEFTCAWGILTLNTWASYHMGLDYSEVESIASVYRPEINAMLEEAGVI